MPLATPASIHGLQHQANRAALGGDEQVDRLGALGRHGPDEYLTLVLVLLQHELAGIAGYLADATAFDADAGDFLLRDLAEHGLPVLHVQNLERDGGATECQQQRQQEQALTGVREDHLDWLHERP